MALKTSDGQPVTASGAHPGRDPGYPAPPGQIRACAADELGSHLECLTVKRCCGCACWPLAGGSHRAVIGAIAVQVTGPFWQRRPSARFKCQVT